MELTRQDVFLTGSNKGSSGSSKKKDNADERLERLMLRKLPSVSRVQLLCHLSRKKKRAIFAGRSDGIVVYWKPTSARNHDSFELKEYHFVGHQGPVTCLIYDEQYGPDGLLFTGSVDRTIRVWNPSSTNKSQQCVQKLDAHGSTVSALSNSENLLLSCGNDHTMRVWKPAPGRDLLLFPWFECVQSIRMGGDLWVTSIALRGGDTLSAYVVDSEGGLSFYNQQDFLSTMYSKGKNNSFGEKDIFIIDKHRTRQAVHRLGVTHVVIVQSQNFVITLSYDNSMRVFDAMTGNPFLSVDNPHRCRYTGLDWNEQHQELFLVDAKGYVHIWNIYMEKCIKQQRIFHGPLTSISVNGKTDNIFVTGENCLERWHISREMKFEEYKGHVGPVIAILSAELHSSNNKDKHDTNSNNHLKQNEGGKNNDNETHTRRQVSNRIYSASIDNTIRCWDPYDMSCIFTLTETRSEISCMIYLKESNVLVTGNEDGSVRWWNPSSGSTIVLREHTNTVSCMLCAPLNRVDYLITAGYDGKVGIWDITKRRSVKPRLENMFQAHHGVECSIGVMAGNVLDAEILCLAFQGTADDPHKRCFYTGGNDKIIRIWNVISQTLLCELKGHADSVTCMSLDANFLFSGSDDKSIRMWNVTNPADAYEVTSFVNAHSSPIRDLKILDNLGYLVSCAFDGFLKVWNYEYDAETGQTGKVIQRFEHPDQFRCIGYQSSIYHLLGGTEQGGVLSFALSRSLLPEDKQHLVPSDERKDDDASLARLDDEEAELLVELDALSDSD
jgi:WD40 repeat protein